MAVLGDFLQREWEKELLKPADKRSLHKAAWRAFGLDFCIGGVYKLINDILIFAGPLLLNQIIIFLQTPEWPLWWGVLLALGLFISNNAITFATALVVTVFSGVITAEVSLGIVA